MDLSTLALFSLALIVTAGTPGPSIAALVARVLARGWRDVLPFVAALWVGEVIWLGMALAGLSALAQTFQLGFTLLKWAGIGYLVWLAWQMWTAPVTSEGAALPQRASALSMFGAGLAVTLGNPKIMVFYLALLPTLIDMGSVGLLDAALLAVVAVASVALADIAWMALAHRARALLRTPRAVRLSNRIGGLVMGGAAAVMASKA